MKFNLKNEENEIKMKIIKINYFDDIIKLFSSELWLYEFNSKWFLDTQDSFSFKAEHEISWYTL